MAYKRPRTDDELHGLAVELRALWQAGTPVRGWLRDRHPHFGRLLNQGWTWAAIATAMNEAGITYRTGTPWSGVNLRADAFRAAGGRAKDRSNESRLVPERANKPMERGETTAQIPDRSVVTVPPLPGKPRFTHVEFADPMPVVELTAEEREREERIMRKVFGAK